MQTCPISLMLLEEITSGDKLLFKSNKTGTIYEAKPGETMLVNEGISELQSTSKYKNTLRVSAYDSVNPKQRITGGCERCKRKIVSLQRLGEEKRAIYSCLCGNSWSMS